MEIENYSDHPNETVQLKKEYCFYLFFAFTLIINNLEMTNFHLVFIYINVYILERVICCLKQN